LCFVLAALLRAVSLVCVMQTKDLQKLLPHYAAPGVQKTAQTRSSSSRKVLTLISQLPGSLTKLHELDVTRAVGGQLVAG
jgi:hypothetical protein